MSTLYAALAYGAGAALVAGLAYAAEAAVVNVTPAPSTSSSLAGTAVVTIGGGPPVIVTPAPSVSGSVAGTAVVTIFDPVIGTATTRFKVGPSSRAFAVRFTPGAIAVPSIQGTTMTCEKPQVIGPLFVGETVTASFEFARQTSAPSAPSVDVVRYSGADDPTPAALKSGAASVSGTQVLQHLTGAVAGVTYLLTAWATAPDGNRYAARQALLEVRAPS